ncbi:YonK family protein [Lysinibacillus xylanilyticus]|uniref:YonK family protein n=1 Tax=Lysinibacillus xylanilyticus TaxID=582475 RepID=UPI0037F77AA6
MAKRVNSASLKGKLDIDWALGSGILTETTKDGDFEYDLFKLIEEFNGKAITISIKEEDTLPTIDEYNVSDESDGTEEEDFFKED